MKSLKYILLCLLFPLCCGLKAQMPHITVESINGFPSQAYYNQQYTTFTVLLHNHDSSYYQGNIYIVFHTDTLNTFIDSTSFGGPYLINIPGDTFTTISIATFYFNPGSFKLGGNVVVVWPVSAGGSQIMAVDSFTTYVEILGYAGISDITPLNNGNNIYPVPADDVLFLPQNIAENSIEHVRIIDMLGQTKYHSNKAVTSINISLLEQGVYFIEIKMKNTTPKVSKFVISR